MPAVRSQCPTWEKFLERIFPDESDRALLNEQLGRAFFCLDRDHPLGGVPQYRSLDLTPRRFPGESSPGRWQLPLPPAGCDGIRSEANVPRIPSRRRARFTLWMNGFSLCGQDPRHR